jgi:hypothetical protein|eukprot:CAMPEP_0181185786 /NCGR_PEP_ID=MMETSP1096-20121128/9693_1 /TAXON_ID=156174 ORGANISM="Chrysochromulina ericina, Strain CCMP281" /NCGR_SAMPLE_ID=MMETSP1096 /ASSEMBLY_ACC=CAM_ASM_000453 /LENGTH=108 /DNA_ID=CAMNT_0023274653 /DNA_START=1579 /DNA_END=1905 /DNA_ORIENTATION=-
MPRARGDPAAVGRKFDNVSNSVKSLLACRLLEPVSVRERAAECGRALRGRTGVRRPAVAGRRHGADPLLFRAADSALYLPAVDGLLRLVLSWLILSVGVLCAGVLGVW